MSEEKRSQPGSLYLEVGKNITRYRKELSLSQTELAPKIGISQTHLASIELGVRRISLEDLYKVARFFKISIADLLPSEVSSKKPGPRPKLAVAYEKLTGLSEKEQNAVMVMIDSLAAANQSS